MAMAEFVPATATELARWLHENFHGQRYPVCPAGGRTSLPQSISPPGEVLIGLHELNQLVDYPARDLTVTVEAGMSVAQLNQILEREGQRLPIDVPQAERATVGGAMACNVSGPLRLGHGTWRDYVIGLTAIDASGRLFHSGGRVVKNVAGYDLCKLLVGARGSLAVVTQVTCKVKPIPERSAWWWLTLGTFGEIENLLQRLMTSSARPTALEMLNVPAAQLIVADARLSLPSQHPVLAINVQGTAAEVEYQLACLRRELVPFGINTIDLCEGAEAARLHQALVEFPVPTDVPLTFQVNMRPSQCWRLAELATELGMAVACHAGNGIAIGQLPDSISQASEAMERLAPLRALVRSLQGNLQILRGDREWEGTIPWCSDPEPSWAWMKRLKRQLDPHGILNPGRFIDAPVSSTIDPVSSSQRSERP